MLIASRDLGRDHPISPKSKTKHKEEEIRNSDRLVHQTLNVIVGEFTV